MSEVQFFVNEVSLIGQFHSEKALVSGLLSLMGLLETARSTRAQSLYKSNILVSRTARNGEHLLSTVNSLSDRSLRDQIKALLFDRACARTWEQDQIHDVNDIYSWQGQSVNMTSMAELACRQKEIRHFSGALLNLEGSNLPEPELVVFKQSKALTDEIKLNAFQTLRLFKRWISQAFPSVEPYNDASKYPPTDAQTILGTNPLRFQRLDRLCKGRIVYKERTTGYYWHVDSLHFGRSAEIEVYDKRERHIGTATLKGELDLTKKVQGRKLRIGD